MEKKIGKNVSSGAEKVEAVEEYTAESQGSETAVRIVFFIMIYDLIFKRPDISLKAFCLRIVVVEQAHALFKQFAAYYSLYAVCFQPQIANP